MDDSSRISSRFSIEPETTIQAIWQYSQQPGDRFDTEAVGEAIDYGRQIRRGTTAPGRFSFSNLLEGQDSPEVRDEVTSRTFKRKDKQLQNSFRLLDDAVATPGSILRRKTPLRHSKYTPMHVSASSQFDVSNTFGPTTSGDSMIATPSSRILRSSKNSFGDSMAVQPMSGTLHSSMFTEEAGEDSCHVFHDEDPDEAVGRDLYSSFLHCLRTSQMDNQVLGLLAQYEDACSEIIKRLKRVVNRSVPGQDR
ncbi:hypothetical protein LSAT2_003941 [Lamellibrachia satsuma]|nr:hypothetical protein LSAT2_003941 [Lamellibrachia satsuma]